MGGELGSDVDEEVIGGGVDVNIVFSFPRAEKSQSVSYFTEKSQSVSYFNLSCITDQKVPF